MGGILPFAGDAAAGKAYGGVFAAYR